MALTPSRRRILVTFVGHWLPLLVWMAWIYWLSDQPKLPHPGRKGSLISTLFDYGSHIFVFGVLTFLFWRVWCAHLGMVAQRAALRWALPGAGLCAALYGAVDEMHQAFVPGRWCMLADWLADVVGIVLCVAGLALWKYWRARSGPTFRVL